MPLSQTFRLAATCLVLACAARYGDAQTVRLPTYRTAAKTLPKVATGIKPPACWLFPTRSVCLGTGSDRIANINTFYGTNDALSYFGQIKSIYNGSSGSATISADLTSLNFTNGMQVTAGSNIQAGSSSATAVGSGTVPTLASTAAAQATQNMLYGGTVYVSALYPLIAYGAANITNPGAFGVSVDLIGREGIDVQSFTPGTSISVTSPPSHSSAQIEGYLQYNSTNSPSGSSTGFAGAVFIGGSYGYSYTSHGYARDYGFAGNVSNGMGQISAGILMSGVVKIAISRAFGPSQTYIDATSMTPTTVNNFKAWSIGITYQAPAPASK